MMNKLLLLISLIPFLVEAKWNEDDYVNTYCNGKVEYLLPDKTRVDCLTDTHAIEYDFGYKLYDATGQSLHYALMTNKKAGIVLIIDPKDKGRYYQRLIRIINTIPCLPNECPAIDVWTINLRH